MCHPITSLACRKNSFPSTFGTCPEIDDMVWWVDLRVGDCEGLASEPAVERFKIDPIPLLAGAMDIPAFVSKAHSNILLLHETQLLHFKK